MIETLHISNYALIEEIEINFNAGFNVITGETGAGKSIIMGALSMLLGARADSRVAGTSGKKSVIEATFLTGNNADDVINLLREQDIEWDETGRCILRREILPTGRSRAFINDTPVNLTVLQSVAARLVDIHSQHQNMLLSSREYQLKVLDAMAGNRTLLEDYTAKFNEYRKALHDYKVAKKELTSNRADEEYMRFQLSQLEELNLVAGEQAELEKERDLLANLTEIKATLNVINEAFSGGDSGILSRLKNVENQASELTGLIEDASMLMERIEALRIEARDIADTFTEMDNDINADPSHLEDIEQRLADIYELERKHHVDTVDELIILRDRLRESLKKVANGDDHLQQLETNARKAKRAALTIARELSEKRSREAERFAEQLKERAVPLAMKNLRCQISLATVEMSSTGIDTVDFLFAFNKNQTLTPVGGTASGGEISRLMLSLKAIIADKMQLPTIIFDEVDTGVSGDVAARMGTMMRDIARNIQVIAITHLPQVAALASTQYKVYKEDSETSTSTRIVQLSPEERVEQIAAMLSGDHIDEAARANARSLLGK